MNPSIRAILYSLHQNDFDEPAEGLYLTQLLQFAKSAGNENDVEGAALVLSRSGGSNIVNERSPIDGRNALHHASRVSSVAMVQMLLNHGGSLCKKTLLGGQTGNEIKEWDSLRVYLKFNMPHTQPPVPHLLLQLFTSLQCARMGDIILLKLC